MSVALPKGDQFYGHLEIKFNAVTTKTFLEFTGNEVRQLRINGKEQKADIQSNRIHIVTKQGKNTVTMLLLNDYRDDISGLSKWVDSGKDQQYVYSDLEPNMAHYIFPMFDQPDLRAKWQLHALAPNDWKVISNEAKSSPDNGALKLINEAADVFGK